MKSTPADNPPAILNAGELVQTRKAIVENPLVAAKGLTSDLLSLHAINLSALTKAIQQPGVLLDEDRIPHKLILERISSLQKDILGASNALLRINEALESKENGSRLRTDANGVSEGDTPTDVSAIVLELTQNHK